jgi:hypothetical protein
MIRCAAAALAFVLTLSAVELSAHADEPDAVAW